MGRYIGWNDLVRRYPIAESKGGDDEVDAEFIVPAEAELEGRLASVFNIPFTSSNITAKDLSIDIAYYRMTLTNKSIDSEELRKSIDSRIDMLLSGKSVMVDSGGVALFNDTVEAYSTIGDYAPTFNMGSELNWQVNSSHLQDIEDDLF